MGSGASNTFPLRRFTQYARLAGTAAVVVGTLVLLGWLLDVGLLKSVLPGKIAMKPITAICFVLLGAALVLLVLAPAQHVVSATRRRAAVVCATLAAATGLATLCEYRFGVDLGIDRLFFRDSLLVKADPGRMAANTALAFVQLGGSLLLLDARHKIGRLCSELLALATLVLGAIALLGYLYGIESLHTLFAYTPIAVHTAFLLVLLGLGVLLSHSESGLTSVITSERSGGVMARRIMPVAVFLLIALTWMRLKGGLALFVASSITVLVVWVWLIARSLNSLDAKKEQALGALLVSELRYRRLFESAKEGILILDAISGQIVDVNPFLIEMLGYSKDEFVGKELWEIGVFKDIVASKAAFVELQQQEYIRYEDLPLETRGGLVKQVEFVSNSYLAGEIRVIQCNVRDISDRKRAEELLRQGEILNRSLVEHLPHRIFVKDRNSAYLFCNSNYALDLGIGPKQIVGKDDFAFFPPALAEGYRADDREVMAAGKTKDIEERYKLAGAERWIHTVKVPYRGEQGEIIGVLGLFEDITERKLAEAQRELLSALVEASPDFVGFADPKTAHIQYINKHGRKMCGIGEDEDLGKLKISDMHPAWMNKIMADVVMPAVVRDGLWEGEGAFLHRNGHEIPVLMTLLARKAANGEVDLFYTVSRDITERKLLEDQLRQSQKMEAIGQLAGGVAHDFNNLLTAINGYSSLALQRIEGNPTVKNYLEEIKKAGDRAANLTRQLLAFGRKQILQPLAINLNEVVSDMNKMLRRLIGEDIQLAAKLDPDVGKVMADPGQIEQVLVNLIVNARDAMPRGGNLTIETRNVELDEDYGSKHVGVPPGKYVLLAVSDTGDGMSEDVRRRVFEPFFTTKEKGKGTGLGLSTVYGIVKQSGGNIWVYSEPDKGTTFKVYLPQVEPKTRGPAEKAAEAAPRGGSETILLVEDEEVVRGLARRILEQAGYSVVEAGKADEALRFYEEHVGEIDLLLTDVVMPGMSGKELADQLKSQCPELKMLFMSGYTDEAIVHHGILDSSVEFIQKPFTPAGLIKRVRDVLDSNGRAR